ncbi:CHAD domain-containing protein [Methylobacillus gramineus]|uniref:CYTH and CHAD domain-containing protein n=1 Tax=Methylobacillus gramineus TaxID=755169 RepID=UPI001CFFD69D|nr:CYTH and CHAD domain-containing protein [Methylobacillus gramineus]MCB5183638.1 CHAD domain-containing protein [Methylobacillus gramineus]
MPNEIELKLRIAVSDIPRLRRHPVIRQHLSEKAITRRLVSTYYDTEDLQLLDKRLSLRVRRMSGGWFQAVKAAGHSLAGLHQRLEWEDIIAKGEPDFTKIIDPMLTPVFDDLTLRKALKPIFTTDMRRTEWQLQYEGSHIELSLDAGQVIAGKQQQAMTEIELELKQGDIKHLFELALALQADIALTIENVSKAQRGYAYYRDFPFTPSHAKPTGLTKQDNQQEAFEKIAWECLRHLQSNQEIALTGADPEGVHQMRIALRQLSAALRLFGLADEALKAELDWLNTLLGSARDLDVLLTESLPKANLDPGNAAGIYQRARTAQKRAYSRLRAGLNSQRYQRLLLVLGLSAANGLAPSRHALAHTASSKLEKHLDKLLVKGKKLHKLADDERHQVRISARRLRYATDFFSPLYPGKKTQRQAVQFRHALSALQGLLGKLNDLSVTRNLLSRLAKRDPALQPTLSHYLDWANKHEKRHKKSLSETWKALKEAKKFW